MILIDDPNLINLYPKDNSRMCWAFQALLLVILTPKELKIRKYPTHFSNIPPLLRSEMLLAAYMCGHSFRTLFFGLNLLEFAINYPKKPENRAKRA